MNINQFFPYAVLVIGAAMVNLLLQLAFQGFLAFPDVGEWVVEISIVALILVGHHFASGKSPVHNADNFADRFNGNDNGRTRRPGYVTMRRPSGDKRLKKPRVSDSLAKFTMASLPTDTCADRLREVPPQNKINALLSELRHDEAYEYVMKLHRTKSDENSEDKYLADKVSDKSNEDKSTDGKLSEKSTDDKSSEDKFSDKSSDKCSDDVPPTCYLRLASSLLGADIVDGGNKAMAVWDVGVWDENALKTLVLAAWPRHLPEAAQWLCLMEDDAPQMKKVLHVIHDDLAACKDLSSAKLFYSHLSRPSPRIYSMFFRMAGTGGDVAFCEKMLEDMKTRDQQPVECHVNGLLNALAKTFQPIKAEQVYQTYYENGQLEPNQFTFGCLINCWAKVGDVLHADRWLQTMIKMGIQPNEVTYSSVLHACARSENLAKAEYYTGVMKDLGLINTVVLNIMLKACMVVGNLERAEHWMAEMEECGLTPDEFSYNTMISCCVKAKQFDKVQQWLGVMRDRNIKRSEIGYNVLLSAKMQQGMRRREEILDWLKNMIDDGVKPSASTFNTIIQCFKTQNDAEDARYWWDQLALHCRPNSISFTVYAKILAQSGDYLAVEKLYYQGQKMHERLDEAFFSSLFVACAKAVPPQRERAEQWFDEFCRTGKNNRINRPLRRSLAMIFGEETYRKEEMFKSGPKRRGHARR